MKGIVIADAGPVFSLALIDRLDILEEVFGEVKIAEAVWREITLDQSVSYYDTIYDFFENKVQKISNLNDLTFVMDEGESESVVLYQELDANYLLIDDMKARKIAESLNINCMGTLGLLAIAKERNLVVELRPLFETFLQNKRYYGKPLLNMLLSKYDEEPIT